MVFSLALAGCTIEPIDISDRQCDDDHPCAAEYTCVEEICERNDELDDEEGVDGEAEADVSDNG